MKNKNCSTRHYVILPLLALTLSACTNYEYHETREVEISRLTNQQEQQVEEQAVLDVGIVLFDPGELDLDSEEANFSNVRNSEAVWITQLLKTTLEDSNAWGLVRSLPIDEQPMDLTITGQILESNGEVLRLQIRVVDSTFTTWMDKEYGQQASQYAYNPEVNFPGDPFQAMFNEIANDLFDQLQALSIERRKEIRLVSQVAFAQDFLPDAFADYLIVNEQGQRELQRVPAEDDDAFMRVERIRARNDLFVDVVQDYYRTFNKRMQAPYDEWRKLSYKEVLYARQLKEQGRRERIAGIVAIAGGIAAATSSNSNASRAAGHVGIISGARVYANSFNKTNQALSHNSQLRELSNSLERDLEPSIIELQDRSVTLTGTVQDQYREWRRILAELYRLEEGVDTPVLPVQPGSS